MENSTKHKYDSTLRKVSVSTAEALYPCTLGDLPAYMFELYAVTKRRMKQPLVSVHIAGSPSGWATVETSLRFRHVKRRYDPQLAHNNA
jgi:hypothetical protein